MGGTGKAIALAVAFLFQAGGSIMWTRLRYCLYAALLFSGVARADVGFDPGFNNFIQLNWAGQGDIVITQDACIFSFTGFFNRNRYSMRVTSNSPAPSPGAPFAAYDASANFSVPFGLTVFDLHAGGSAQTVQPDQYTNVLEYDGCNIGERKGPNARLEMRYLASDLYQVPQGDYEISFDVEGRRVNQRGQLTGDRETQTNVLGRIRIPPLVRISRVDPITLGIYNGVDASVSANEGFCIYTNVSNYTVQPTTATQGSSPDEFAMASGANRLEYTVRVSNSANAAGGELLSRGEVSSPFGANQSAPFSLTCNNSDNAAVFVEVSGEQLETAPAGNYSGVLELLVAPL